MFWIPHRYDGAALVWSWRKISRVRNLIRCNSLRLSKVIYGVILGYVVRRLIFRWEVSDERRWITLLLRGAARIILGREEPNYEQFQECKTKIKPLNPRGPY